MNSRQSTYIPRQYPQRYVKDLAIRGGLNWELSWNEIPASDKAKVFQIVSNAISASKGRTHSTTRAQAREHHPFLKRFRNDWATEEIIKQFFKNKRGRAYQQGWIDVPSKYTYLKANSKKRSTDGSRVKRAKAILAARKSKKRPRASPDGAGAGSTGVRGDVEMSDEEEDEDDGGMDVDED